MGSLKNLTPEQPRGPLTDFEKSLLGEHPIINEHPIIVYRDVENVWACRVCPSVTFHLYSDGVGRCVGCGFAPDAFKVACAQCQLLANVTA